MCLLFSSAACPRCRWITIHTLFIFNAVDHQPVLAGYMSTASFCVCFQFCWTRTSGTTARRSSERKCPSPLAPNTTEPANLQLRRVTEAPSAALARKTCAVFSVSRRSLGRISAAAARPVRRLFACDFAFATCMLCCTVRCLRNLSFFPR